MAEQQYALTSGGSLVLDRDGHPVISPYLSEAPTDHSSFYPANSKWLPVEDRDTQPFDIRTHCRLAPPEYVVEAGRVLRIFTVKTVRAA